MKFKPLAAISVNRINQRCLFCDKEVPSAKILAQCPYCDCVWGFVTSHYNSEESRQWCEERCPNLLYRPSSRNSEAGIGKDIKKGTSMTPSDNDTRKYVQRSRPVGKTIEILRHFYESGMRDEFAVLATPKGEFLSPKSAKARIKRNVGLALREVKRAFQFPDSKVEFSLKTIEKDVEAVCDKVLGTYDGPEVEIIRFEIIDHTNPIEEARGRTAIVSPHEGKVVEYSLQDEGQTLKVFIREKKGGAE